MKRLLPFILLAACLWLLFGGKLPEWNVLTPSGPRYVLIAHETASDTSAHALLFNALRNGPTAAYAKERGHRLDILDADEPSIAKFKPFAPPEVLVVKPPNAVLYRGPLPDSADAVLATLKEHGG